VFTVFGGRFIGKRSAGASVRGSALVVTGLGAGRHRPTRAERPTAMRSEFMAVPPNADPARLVRVAVEAAAAWFDQGLGELVLVGTVGDLVDRACCWSSCEAAAGSAVWDWQDWNG